MWFSDLNIDINYVYESSTSCLDIACCHKDNVATSDSQKAPLFGHENCHMPIDGYIKMIDTINALNNTLGFAEIGSIIYGGSSNANIPGVIEEK